MKKAFCDICGKEGFNGWPVCDAGESFHSQHHHSSLNGRKFKFQIKGMLWTTKDECAWEFFDVCKGCLAQIVMNIEEVDPANCKNF